MLPNVWGTRSLNEIFSAGDGKVNLSKIRARLGVGEDSRTRRATQRALHKKLLKQSRRLPKEALDALRSNPMQYGCPRAFKVLITGDEAVTKGRVHDRSSYTDEGHRLFFPRFGDNDGPARFNDVWVTANDVHISADKRVCAIRASVAAKGKQKGGVIALYLDFTLPNSPTGFISAPSGYCAVYLEPDAVEYRVQVSANAGAERTADGRYLDWDEKSVAWTSATWEDDSMSFAFDTIVTEGAFGKELTNEVSFGDRLTGKSMELGLEEAGRYSCWMDQNALDHNNIYLHSIVSDPSLIPPAPAERAERSIKTVFPATARFRFDGLGCTFTGAYETEDGGSVYAVKGHIVSAGGQQERTRHDIFSSSIQAVRDPFRQSERPGTSKTPKALQSPALDVVGLMSLSPLVPDPESSGGARDIVSSLRDQDVHNIITYYMEDDIRKTFIQEEPIELSDPVVLAIAKDKPENEAEVRAFYRSLQAPYVVSKLARSNLREAPTFNGMRADAQLKDTPAGSALYDRHANALYQYRFGCQFPAFKLYLEDQQTHDYADTMRSAAVKIKDRIAAAVADLGAQGGNAQAAALNLAAASLDIDELCSWAIEKKLFWAFRLYDHLTSIYLPTLYNQIMDGSAAAGVSQLMKAHSTVLSLLEHNEANPNGNSFTKAWHRLLMAFNAAAVIPQYIDAACALPLFGAILEDALNDFQNKAAKSTAPSVILAAKNAEFLVTNPTVQKQLLWAFQASMSAKGSKGTWPSLVKRFKGLVQTAGWVEDTDARMNIIEFFLYFASATLMAFPMVGRFPSGWDTVPADKKRTVSDSVSGMVLSLAIKAGGGLARTSSLWADVGSLTPHMKALFGFGEVEAHAFETVWLIQYQTAVHYNRAGPQSMQLPVLPDYLEDDPKNNPACTRSGNQESKGNLGFVIAAGVAGAAISLCSTACLVAVFVVGIFVAVAVMVFSAMRFMEGDPLWKAAAAFNFLGGLGLLVICTAGLAYGVVSAATWSFLVDVCFPPAFGITLILFAIGIVLMSFAGFMPRPKTPSKLQKFIDKHAEPAGLMMPHKTAVDYFDVVPSDSTHPSLPGLCLSYGSDQQCFLQLGTMAKGQAVPVQASTTVTHFPDTCWSVSTNSQGLSTIFTTITLGKDDAQGRQQQQPLILCLTRVEDNTVVAMPPPSETVIDEHGKKVQTDPEVYQQQLSRQQWKLTCATDDVQMQTRVVENKPVSFLTSARFQITHGSGDNMKSLIMAGTPQSGHKPALVDLPTRHDNNAGFWTLLLQAVAPPAFQYSAPTWDLTTESRGESLSACFFGPVSLPLTVTVTPILPPFLRLSPAQDSTGSIEQVPETKPVPMKPTCFTVRAYIDIDGRRYEQSAKVTISVQDPDAECHDVGKMKAHANDTASFSSYRAHTPLSSATGHCVSLGEEEENPTAAYDSWLDKTPPFFRWQQENAVALKDHWTAQAAISRMQDSFAKFDWRGGNYHGLYFPRRDPGPPLSLKIGVDNIKYEDAAAAFVALAIKEGDPHASGSVDVSKAQRTIEAFNASLQATNVDRFLEWLNWDGSIPLTGGTPRCGKQEYIECLTSPTWVRMHIFLGPYWVNASLEMFFHFLKLKALGATDDEIQAVYNKLTVGQEGKVLNPGWFPDITPSSWRTWRAYLLSGPNNGITRLSVSNLGRSKHYQYYAARTVITGMEYADTVFLSYTGYRHSSKGGCCLSGASRVLMGDGRTLKPIDAIQPGETVMGPRGCPRVVTFVSRPQRNGRPLYAYKSAPDLLFTADHPFYLGCLDTSWGTPILGFVHPAEALAINPLWAAFPLRQIPSDQLLTVAPADAAAHDVLFDLILDPDSDCDVPCYAVRGSRDSGGEIMVYSEAPNPRMLPCATAFVVSFAAAIAASSSSSSSSAEHEATIARFFPDGLASGMLDYRGRITYQRAPCATAAYYHGATGSKPSLRGPKTMSSAVEVLHGSEVLAPQVIADATEAVLGSMGLDLQVVADNGWRHVGPNGDPLFNSEVDQPAESEVWVLSTHFLDLSQQARHPISEGLASLPACYQMVVDLLGDALGNSPNGAVHVEVQLPLAQGWAAVSSSAAERVAVRGVAGGRYLRRLRVDLVIPDGVIQSPDDDDGFVQEVTVRIRTPKAVLVASGMVAPDDLTTARFPVYVQELVGADEAMLGELAHWHVAWLHVTFGKVQKSRLGLAEAWKDSDGSLLAHGQQPERLDVGVCGVRMGSLMEAYAEMLGDTVGRGVIESLVGGSGNN
ncbi:hypothetical protein V8F20_005402 [Naviculisporaceae sp. PSN 640]